MRKRTWGLLLILTLAVGLAAFAFWPFPNRLGRLADVGDKYDVEILRDTYGVPHVFGVTDSDTAFGLAYSHAEDDFLTIQQGVVAARGDLAKYYGMDAAANDYMVDLLKVWELVDREYETQLSAETRAISEAYADGINLYAAQNPDQAFRGVFPVSGKDVVAGSVHKSPLFFGLDGTLGDLFERVNEDETASWLEDRLADSMPASPFLASQSAESFTGLGSNAFAVAPSRTADGATYFASNSHQPWTGPVAWYEAHLHSEEGWDAVGGLFPGMPVITLGHNRDLGWTFTVNSPDLIDVYSLTLNPDNPDQYLLDGEWRDFEIERSWLHVNLVRTAGWGSETFGRFNLPVPREVVWSAFGPVFRNDSEAYALRYAAHDSIGIYEQLFQMNKARNLSEWETALATPGLPMFNIAYADKAGNIGYVYNALMPARADGFDWSGMLETDDSDAIWQAYEPLDALPQVWNPPIGFVQNANSSPFQTTRTESDPAETPAKFGVETLMTNRALRLLELFSADSSITWDEFVAYKYDVVFSAESDMADWIARLDAHDFDDRTANAAVDRLVGWDRAMSAGSTEASLALMLLSELHEHPQVELGISHLVGSTVPDEVLLSSFQAAREKLHRFHGGDEVVLAQLNRIQRGDVDIGMGGAPDVPHAIYGPMNDIGRFVGIAGDSYIILVRWDADGNVHSESLHQFGSATNDASSPHYADQVSLFANRQLKPVWLTEADVRENLTEAYRPQDR